MLFYSSASAATDDLHKSAGDDLEKRFRGRLELITKLRKEYTLEEIQNLPLDTLDKITGQLKAALSEAAIIFAGDRDAALKFAGATANRRPAARFR